MSDFLYGFSSTSHQEWVERVKKDLKTEDISDVLKQDLKSGIHHPPYQDQDSLTSNHWTTRFRNYALNDESEWQGARYWLNLERLKGQDSQKLNQSALQALKGGAEGIDFITDTQQWDQLFHDISLEHCYLGFAGDITQVKELTAFLANRKVMAGNLRISNQYQNLEALADLTKSLAKSNLRCLTLYETSGHGDQIRHTAMLICKCIHLVQALSQHGLNPHDIAQKLHFEVLMGDQYLWEICRLRILRIILGQVLAQFGIAGEQCRISLGASTTVGAGTDDNPELQMLHNTTQSMAAILGGCDLLTVRPHEGGFEESDPQRRRIARNIGLLLREESYLHRAGDAVAGSYYLETLMDEIAQAVWKQVREIEAGGGFIKYQKIL